MKKISQVLILGALLVSIVWAGKGIFKYSVFHTHDLKHHLTRSYDAVVALKEGHFPLRWAGTSNFECGVPHFNFYYPLYYYLIAFFSFLVGGIILPLKLLSFFSLAVGTLFFYLWIREETKDPLASFAGAILYLYAPYRFLLIYVRGSPEYLAYAILPIIFFFFSRFFSTKKPKVQILDLFFAAIFGSLLVISHNVVAMFMIPIIFLYLVVKVIVNKPSSKSILILFFTCLSIFGLSAFFVLPMIFEQSFTKIGIPILGFQDHFPTISQLFFSKWGYGDSAIGEALDAMSFQLGYAQWVVLGSILLMPKILIRDVKVLTFFILSIFLLFLVTPLSMSIWERFKFLQIIHFSWRLLGILVFTISALYALWLTKIKNRVLYWAFLIVLPMVAFIGNRNHLLPQPALDEDLPFYQYIDSFQFPRRSMPSFSENILPPSAAGTCYLNTPVVSTNNPGGKLEFEEIKRGSTYGVVDIVMDNNNSQSDKIIFNLGYFPEIFSFKSGDKKINYFDCNGRVCVNTSDLRTDSNQVSWRVVQSKVEQRSNYITLLFLIVWISAIVYVYLRYRIKNI